MLPTAGVKEIKQWLNIQFCVLVKDLATYCYFNRVDANPLSRLFGRFVS